MVIFEIHCYYYMKKLLTLSVSVLLCWQAGMAQQKIVADKIVAIVGDKIVLKSEIDGELMNQERDQQKELPANAACNIMEQIVAQKVLVLQAERDSLPVSDADVDGEIDNRIRYFQNMYGTAEKMRQVTGYTRDATPRPGGRGRLRSAPCPAGRSCGSRAARTPR